MFYGEDSASHVPGLSPGPLLLLFLGSSIGNLDRCDILDFLQQVRSHLRPGDFFLLGADLIKDIDIPFKKFVLKNGLTLIVHEDHKAPIVAVNVWYHVCTISSIRLLYWERCL